MTKMVDKYIMIKLLVPICAMIVACVAGIVFAITPTFLRASDEEDEPPPTPNVRATFTSLSGMAEDAGVSAIAPHSATKARTINIFVDENETARITYVAGTARKVIALYIGGVNPLINDFTDDILTSPATASSPWHQIAGAEVRAWWTSTSQQQLEIELKYSLSTRLDIYASTAQVNTIDDDDKIGIPAWLIYIGIGALTVGAVVGIAMMVRRKRVGY